MDFESDFFQILSVATIYVAFIWSLRSKTYKIFRKIIQFFHIEILSRFYGF